MLLENLSQIRWTSEHKLLPFIHSFIRPDYTTSKKKKKKTQHILMSAFKRINILSRE